MIELKNENTDLQKKVELLKIRISEEINLNSKEIDLDHQNASSRTFYL